MKYYEIVLYSTNRVQRIKGLPEEDILKFKAWLLDDKNNKPYEMNFQNSMHSSKTESSIIFKNNLVNIDIDLIN